jgi:hypothetical protein
MNNARLTWIINDLISTDIIIILVVIRHAGIDKPAPAGRKPGASRNNWIPASAGTTACRDNCETVNNCVVLFSILTVKEKKS